MPNLDSIAREGSGARLNKKQYADFINAMKDAARMDYLTELVKLPTVSIHFSDDEPIEEDGPPVGYTIRADDACMPAVQVTGQTLRETIDLFKVAMKKAQKTEG